MNQYLFFFFIFNINKSVLQQFRLMRKRFIRTVTKGRDADSSFSAKLLSALIKEISDKNPKPL